MINIDYIIFAADFVPNSAGVRALYILADRLNSKGYKTYVTGSGVTDPNLNAPLIPLFLARQYAKIKSFTAIYPEIIHGNPIGAERVARWVLNRPGLLGGETVYDPNEIVFNYSDVFASYVENKISGKLYLPTIDESIFYDDGTDDSKRSLECFYVGKSTFKEGFFDRKNVFEITRTSPPKSELGKLFRASKVLYCFDNSTILLYEAAMCGCPAVVIPDGTQTRSDYEKLELGMNGIAWGLEELDRARSTVRLMKPHYERTKLEFDRQVDELIRLTTFKSQLRSFDNDEISNFHKSSLKSECPSCEPMEEEIRSLYAKLLQFQKSRYFALRWQLELRFPRLNRFATSFGIFGFNVLRFFKRTVLDRFAKRKSEKIISERREILAKAKKQESTSAKFVQ